MALIRWIFLTSENGPKSWDFYGFDQLFNQFGNYKYKQKMELFNNNSIKELSLWYTSNKRGKHNKPTTLTKHNM